MKYTVLLLLLLMTACSSIVRYSTEGQRSLSFFGSISFDEPIRSNDEVTLVFTFGTDGEWMGHSGECFSCSKATVSGDKIIMRVYTSVCGDYSPKRFTTTFNAPPGVYALLFEDTDGKTHYLTEMTL